MRKEQKLKVHDFNQKMRKVAQLHKSALHWMHALSWSNFVVRLWTNVARRPLEDIWMKLSRASLPDVGCNSAKFRGCGSKSGGDRCGIYPRPLFSSVFGAVIRVPNAASKRYSDQLRRIGRERRSASARQISIEVDKKRTRYSDRNVA